jgi:hypothetical protein
MKHIKLPLVVISTCLAILLSGDSCHRPVIHPGSESHNEQTSGQNVPGLFGSIEVSASDCGNNRIHLGLWLDRMTPDSCPSRYSYEFYNITSIYVASKITDSTGVVVFDSLAPGLYRLTNMGVDSHTALSCLMSQCLCISVRPHSVSLVTISMGDSRIPEANEQSTRVWESRYRPDTRVK